MNTEKNTLEITIYNQFWNKFYKRIQLCENEDDLKIVKQEIANDYEATIQRWENLPCIEILSNCKDALLQSVHRKEVSFYHV